MKEFGPIKDWTPPVKRRTVHPERMGKKSDPVKAGKKTGGSEDALDPITEQKRKEMIRQSWALKHRDPTD